MLVVCMIHTRKAIGGSAGRGCNQPMSLLSGGLAAEVVEHWQRLLARRFGILHSGRHLKTRCGATDAQHQPTLAMPREVAAAVCSFCERSVEEEIGGFKRRGLLKIVDGSHGEVLCCTACWEGW